ncbi:MAG: DUF6702 family protein [Bacteroidota bacterium]
MKLIAILMAVMGFVTVHEYHISICEINHNPDQNLLEITHRIFANDLENALRPTIAHIDVLNAKHYEANDQHIKMYIQARLEVISGAEELEIQWLGHVIKADQIVCFYELILPERSDHFQFSNTTLMEQFKDQKTLLHWSRRGENLKCIILDSDKTYTIINFYNYK